MRALLSWYSIYTVISYLVIVTVSLLIIPKKYKLKSVFLRYYYVDLNQLFYLR